MKDKNGNEIDVNQFNKYVKLGKVILRDMNYDRYSSYVNAIYRKYDRETITSWMEKPETHVKELRNASIYLYEVSSHYRRLINYFAKLSTLSYVVLPYKMNMVKKPELDKIKRQYQKILHVLEVMNIRHELVKILTVCFREDVYYGYVYKTPDSYYIRQLDSDYCKITKIEDGCFLYQFDFTFFDRFPNMLESYGEEFETKYELYRLNKAPRWQDLDPKREFCVKINEDIPFPMPPFIGVFYGIYDIDDYKSLKKSQTEIGNYKILGMEIPLDSEGNYQIDQDTALTYYRNLTNVLPENIGAFLTPMKVTDYEFEKSGSVDDNKVNDAVQTFWDDAGVGSLLFSNAKQTSATLRLSIMADEQIVFAFMRQIERNINRLLKYETGDKFKIQILDVTYFNQQEMYKTYLSGAQASLPMATMACSAMGLAQYDMMSMNYLENDVMGIFDNFLPLSTSYTQSGDANRPTQEERGETLSDSGEVTRESNANNEN